MGGKCYLICGEDDYLVEQAALKLVERLVPAADRALGLEVVDGRVDRVETVVAAVRACVASLATAGLFGGTKLTWLREPSFLGGKAADSEMVKAALAELVSFVKQGLPEGQTLLLSACQINRNSALFRAFQAAGEVQDFGAGAKPHQREQAAAQRLVELLTQHGLQMESPVRAAFLARVGIETRLVVNELIKLRTYLGRDGVATMDDIQAVVSVGREALVWDWLDAFGERRAAATIRQLRLLLNQAESPIGLVAMLDVRLRELLILREALERKWVVAEPGGAAPRPVWKPLPPAIEAWFAAAESDFRKQSPFRQGKALAQAGGWSLRELRLARHLLLEVREALVSSSLPGDYLLEMAVMRMLGLPRRTGAAAARGRAA